MFTTRIARLTFAVASKQSCQSAIRTYAATAGTRPPIALFGLDGTYANALYTAAAKSSTLEPTASALTNLNNLLKRDTKIITILQTPGLSARDKSLIASELEKHLGGADKGGTVKNFLNTLAENNRLGLLEGVCNKFEQLMSAHRGEVEVTITTASPLDSRLRSRVESAISKSEYSQGKKLKVVAKVKPEIVGGLIVEIGDRTIDFSISSKISKMNKALREAI